MESMINGSEWRFVMVSIIYKKNYIGTFFSLFLVVIGNFISANPFNFGKYLINVIGDVEEQS